MLGLYFIVAICCILSSLSDSAFGRHSRVYRNSLHRESQVIPLNTRLNSDSFFHVNGHSQLKNDLTKRFGKSFQYRKINIKSYPNVNYGEPVQVIRKPNLSNLRNVDVLTLMLSRPCEHSVRKTIRYYTRKTQHKRKYHIVFVLSLAMNSKCNKMIKKESQLYGDILQFNHTEGYHFITLSVFHAFHYVEKLNLPVKYVVKTDSDCVINYKLLHRHIEAYKERQDELYVGMCYIRNTYDYRYKSNKNYVPKALLRKDTFIRYFTDGGGYLISYNLLPRVLLAIQHLPFISHNEDMNVGEAMIRLNVPCTDDKNWMARHGCVSKADCLQYVVVHPNKSIEESIRYYSYLK